MLAFLKGRFFRCVAVVVLFFLLLQYSVNVFGYSSWSIDPKVWYEEKVWQRLFKPREPSLHILPSEASTLNSETDGNLRQGRNLVTLQNNTLSLLTDPSDAAQEPATSLIGLSTTTTTLTTTATTLTTVTTLSQSLPTSTLPLCPVMPPQLVGMLKIEKTPLELTTVERRQGGDMGPGGLYTPLSCSSRHRVAIIIPFRDRDEHLHIFLNHIIPILKRQQLEFRIYVIEQQVGSKFNRAMLMNIGYAEAIKDHDWQCFVFHDVDLLPENDKNIYSCPESPRHMSAAVDSMGYKLPYSAIFGGVSSLTKEQLVNVNGFSNKFFGWGGEDDDLYNRIRKKGYKIIRYPMSIARYSMIKHKKAKASPERYRWLNGGTSRMAVEGINSLKYKLVKTERLKLFTKITVVINQAEVMGTTPKSDKGKKKTR